MIESGEARPDLSPQPGPVRRGGTVPALRYHVLDTGYCLASEHHIMRGGARRKVRCHSIAVLLRHPERGWFLWDAGYAPRMLDATRRLPYSLYRLATPLRIGANLAVAAQLPRFGLSPSDIGTVIISHFHADHIAGLHDFPQARLVAAKAAYDDVKSRRGMSALRRAFIPALLPADFERRATLISRFDGPALPGLGRTHDLFGDGSALLVPLPGHARGQVGMLARTERGPVLFAADGCWLTRQVRERRPPHPITNLFADDPQAVRSTIDGLHTFMLARPDVAVVPTHCPEAFAREVGR
ncbi:MAG TPA: MBL fold metallo-hydrolase [Chloroflexia bacterium]|jgi:glyoxylase-like metal-dependent hydrolase (beta-lactamase superfamily II)